MALPKSLKLDVRESLHAQIQSYLLQEVVSRGMPSVGSISPTYERYVVYCIFVSDIY